MSTIRINNQSFSGSSITISNGVISIDGKIQTIEGDDKKISIVVDGNVEMLSVDACEYVQVTGSVGSAKTMSGNIRCGDVSGGVNTMSGDVRCKSVAGGVSTLSGDIEHTS